MDITKTLCSRSYLFLARVRPRAAQHLTKYLWNILNTHTLPNIIEGFVPMLFTQQKVLRGTLHENYN